MSKLAEDPSALIDRDALDRFLRGVLPAYEDLKISLLSGGASNLTFLIAAGDGRYVLRRRPIGKSAPRAHDMHREFTAIQALNGVDLPVPRAIAYSEDRAVVREPFYVMDFVDGVALHSPDDAEPLSAEARRQCSLAMVQTLARLHALDPVEVGLEGFGRPENFLQRRIKSWLKQWRAVDHRDLPQVEQLGERLLATVPSGGESTLIHGDYRLGNMLFEIDPVVRLTAILDWEMSTIGDPLTDLAHLLVYWEPTRGRLTHPSQLIARLDGFLDGADLAGQYAESTGRDISGLPYYLAFEHWRAAIIKDAIYLRGIDRQDGDISADVSSLGDSVPLHLAEANDLLSGVVAPTSQFPTPIGEPLS